MKRWIAVLSFVVIILILLISDQSRRLRTESSRSSIADSSIGRYTAAPDRANPTAHPDSAREPMASSSRPTPRNSQTQPQPPSLPPPSVNPASAMLANSSIPARTRIAQVAEIFETYRKHFGAFPTGEDNAAIVRLLTGGNPRSLQFVGSDSAALDSIGQLVDPWSTPYFFHVLSKDHLELRSAGEDLEMWTTDDVVLSIPTSHPATTPR